MALCRRFRETSPLGSARYQKPKSISESGVWREAICSSLMRNHRQRTTAGEVCAGPGLEVRWRTTFPNRDMFCRLKKTLRSPQNPENKGSEFFVPARSMTFEWLEAKSREHGS